MANKKIKNVVWREGKAHGRITRKGVEYWHALETTSPRVAEERVKTWIAELKAQDWGEKPSRSFDEAVSLFEDRHIPKLRPMTQRRYLHSLMNLANSLEGMPLSKITRGVLSEYEHGRRAAGIQSPTIIRDLATLSVLFEVAIGAEWLETNPVKPYLKFAKSHGLTENEPRRRYFSLEEERSLLRACLEMPKHDEETRHGLCLVISLSISTGLRIDELVRLPWRDVDLDRNQITVRGIRAKSKRTRHVPILPQARKILDALPSNPHSVFVLCRKDGRRLKDMYHPLKNAAAYAKIEDVTIHDLRRTCGVRLLRGIGVPRKLSMQEVSTWLGHSSVKVTERHYAFLEIDQLHDAVGTAVQISERASGLLTIPVDFIDESPADP